jgi:HTH-type transcriptional regulator/antitoxin HigA
VTICADFEPTIEKFVPAVADAYWLRELAGFSRERDGIRRARQHLRDAGICLIVEEALPGMHIDGAAFRTSKGNVAIALTLRDPRLEVFWITLIHEVAHLVLHIASGKYDTIFDDVNAPADSDHEDEADVFSREALVPSEAWANCKSQFTWTREAILEDSRRLGVGPAVIVGHIRRQAGDIQFPNGLATNQDVRQQLCD